MLFNIQTIDLNAFYLVAQCKLKTLRNVPWLLKILPLHYLMYQSVTLVLLNISSILP